MHGLPSNARIEELLREEPAGNRAVFPICKLHDTRIVTGFPDGCPLAEDNTSMALAGVRDNSFWDGSGDPHVASVNAEIYSTCYECVTTRMLRHPHVKFLRGYRNA